MDLTDRPADAAAPHQLSAHERAGDDLLARALRRARWTIFWERLWPALASGIPISRGVMAGDMKLLWIKHVRVGYSFGQNFLDRNMLVTQLSPHRHDLGEPFNRSVSLHNSRRHDRDILCDQPRIEAVVLGQHAAGAGELTKLVWVDTSHRHFRREQGTDDAALVTTARLKANCGDCERAQPYHQLGPAGCVVTHRKEPPLRQHHHVQAVLRHVNAAKREHGHLRIPSLLMRARALATVRVWKKRPEHQAHSRFDIRDGCGLPVATGAEL